MQKVIYWHRRLSQNALDKIKRRFHITGTTVNGESIATIDDGDQEAFQKCIDGGFFIVRNKKKKKIKQYKAYTKMEIQKSKALSDVQQFRYEILQWCGNVEDAEKANTFVMGKDEKPVQAQLPKSGNMEDGIYLVHADGKATLFELEYTKDDNMDSEVVAIGLKIGSFGIKIALHDEDNGKGITLTTKDNDDEENDQDYYIDSDDDAVADMDGARNTNHLRNILNPEIKLADDWYIPSLGELYRIFINKKAINAALEFAKGDKLQDRWYWTSTELSATNAWRLSLGGGTTNYWGTKASTTVRVRAVSAFIF